MYRFRFESILTHRKTVEELRQKDLAEALRVLQQETAALAAVQSEQSRIGAELEEKQSAGITASENLIYGTFLDRLSKEHKILQKRKQKAEDAVAEKRNRLLSAVQDRKKLDRLKEKDKDVYTQNMLKQEQALIDEAAISGYIRNTGS